VTRRLFVLRHGERADDVNHAWNDTAPRPHDPPLTGFGVAQARATGRRLADEGVDAIYASPFLRAVHTAHHVAGFLDNPVHVEAGLCEHLNPDWFDERPPTLSPGEHGARFDSVDPAHASVVEPTFPEDGRTAADRTVETARRLLDAEDGSLLLVGHGVTVGAVVEGLTGDGAAAAAPYCGLTRLERTAGAGADDPAGDEAAGAGWRCIASGEQAFDDDLRR
jgi:broad specificity phosphatase PhoE